jgi:hypothetical protein
MTLASLPHTYPGHIRSRLFRDLMLLVLFTVGVLVVVGWYLIGGLKRELASSQIAAATALVRDEVRNLIGPVEQQLLITRDGLRSSNLRPVDSTNLFERFGPVMLHMDQIAGAIFTDDSGAEYFLLREDDEWVARERPPGEDVSAVWTRWGLAGSKPESRSEELDYDPRERPWFISAVEARGERVTWSPPYVFHSLQEPGITAAVSWQAGGNIRVVAMDVTLSRIIDALDHLPLGRDGRGFLFSGSGGVFVPRQGPGGFSASQGSQFFSASEDLGGPLLFDAVAAWEAEGKPADELIRFQSQRRDWWGGFLPMSTDPGTAWVGVALPASETLGLLKSRWQLLALTALAIVALSAGLVIGLMRRYSRLLRDLPKLSIDRGRYKQDIYDLLRGGEDMHLELKSTMRTNLHTGKAGKEIELAWLKGVAAFLNTEGGILLMGVADDGTLVGLEADKFENEDKCRLHFKNLLNQHLGAENARLVRFKLYDLDGKLIGAVECERSDLPVFLRNKNTEAFWIRNGPSNIELPVSRAVKYIRGHF